MNVGELRTAIQARGFEADTAAQQLVFLNTIQRRLAGSTRGRWTEAGTTIAVTAGSGDFALPSAPAGGHVKSVRLAYGTSGAPAPLDRIDAEALFDMRDQASAVPVRSTPCYWTLSAPTTLSLYPVADQVGTLTVRYNRTPPALTGDSDTPILPELYHDLLVVGSCMLVAQRERQAAAVADFRSEFEELHGEMRRQLGIEQQQSVQVVQSSGWYDGTGSCDWCS